LVFLTSDAPRESSSSVQLDRAGPGGPIVILRKQDALYLRPPDEFASLPVTTRGVRELNALSNFSLAVNSVRGVEALQKKVLESLLEVAPAVRVAILLTDENTGEFTSVLGWDRNLGPNQPVHVSPISLGYEPRFRLTYNRLARLALAPACGRLTPSVGDRPNPFVASFT
jgi:hypothetical protein